MLCSLSVEAETIWSFPSEDITECTTYLPGYIIAASSSALSSHIFRFATLPDITSIILNVTPAARFSFMRSPVLLRASINVLQRGKVKCTRFCLVGCKYTKHFARSFFHFDFGYPWSHSFYITRKRVL